MGVWLWLDMAGKRSRRTPREPRKPKGRQGLELNRDWIFFFHERQKWQKYHYKALTLLHIDEQAEAGAPREITHNKLDRMG